jgi:exopolyphosphatase/guanosine-5'-triphosphate,3'-diphosphate pyrophosphatase
VTKAVIDVGSNSVLLLVATRQNNQWITIAETSQVTALGKETKATGKLNPQGANKTLQALRQAFDLAKSLGCDEIHAAGTMALRIATDAPEFLRQAEQQQTPIQIISGDQEALLGFLAVAEDPKINAQTITIIDPGGHSTELLTAKKNESDWNIQLQKSFPIGALGLAEVILPDQTLTPLQILNAVATIDDTIGLCYRPHTCGTVVALGATGTNLISIREKLTTWKPELVHGQILDYEEISRAFGWMANLTEAERAAIPGIEPGREKTIHIGALILERFLQATHALQCTVSVRGWRHALLDHEEVIQ